VAGATIDKGLPDGSELRVEFIGACDEQYEDVYALALSSCAFNIIIDEYSCEPGAVYPNVLSQYDPDVNMKHILFQPLFLWEIPNLELDGIVVTWLCPVPISESEFQYCVANGADALSDLLEAADADVADLNRPSVV
jgi:hypothetical protein